MSGEKFPHLNRRDIEARAEKLVLDLSESRITGDPAPDAFAYAEYLGLIVDRVRFDDIQIAGKLEQGLSKSRIEINDSDHYARQNFTVAHEIGHYLLHPRQDWTDTKRTMYRRANWSGDLDSQRAEFQANIFAAALLMPESSVRRLWNTLQSPNYLAPKFRVSKAAMSRRLEELGLITSSPEGISYVDISALSNQAATVNVPPLKDERGQIPRFDPIKLDEHGRIIPIGKIEWDARQDAFHRVLRVIARSTAGEMGDESF